MAPPHRLQRQQSFVDGERRSLWSTLRASLMSHVYALQDRVMEAVLQHCIIYNVAWEDPRIDQQLLKLGPEDTLLVLTTGGCNVLDRLIDGPKHIVAADLNAAQNALLELKLACLRELTHEQFFQLFAHSNRRLFDSLYAPTLRPLLSEAAAAFWDGHAGFFDNVLYSGASGKLARALVALCRLAGLGPMFREIEVCATLEEQRAVVGRYARRVGVVRVVLQLLLPALCPFAGVPASQMTLGGADCVATTLERVFGRTHIASDNYFYYAYLYGKYTRANCPRYLRPEHFAALKAAAGRVTVRTGLLHDVAADYADGYFTSMVLLDHMDWLSDAQVVGEWAVFCRKLHPTRGRVLWRSFAPRQHLAPLKLLRFAPDAIARAEAATPERVGMYNSTHLATLPPGLLLTPAPPAAPRAPDARRDLAALALGLLAVLHLAAVALARRLLPRPAAAALAAALDGAARWARRRAEGGARAARAAAAAADDDDDGEGEGEGEDEEARRPGAAAMLRLLPRLRGGVWVDVGGGLRAQLGALRGGVAPFARVLLALPSPAACERARAAAAAAGLANVTAVCADGGGEAALGAAAGLPEAGTADLVTLSHALAGRADWPRRLDAALALLRPGGILAVCDLCPPAATAAGRAFWAGALPSAAAPHAAAALRALQARTDEVHLERHGATWPLWPAMAPAHFTYFGRKHEAEPLLVAHKGAGPEGGE